MRAIIIMKNGGGKRPSWFDDNEHGRNKGMNKKPVTQIQNRQMSRGRKMRKAGKQIFCAAFVLFLSQATTFSQTEHAGARQKSQAFQKLQEIVASEKGHAQKAQAIKESLGSVSDHEVLQILGEAHREKETGTAYIIRSELVERWGDTPPFSTDIVRGISNKSDPQESRDFLIHYSTFGKGRNRLTDKDKKVIVDALEQVISDEKEPPQLRGKASIGLSQIDKTERAVKVIAPLVDSEDDDLASKAAHALKFSNNKRAIPILRKKLKELALDPDQRPLVTRSISVSLGKYKDVKSQEQLNDILQETRRIDVFGSAVHALGKMETSESIEMIDKAWEEVARFEKRQRFRASLSCYAALTPREEQIVDIIQKKVQGDPEIAVSILKKMISVGNGYLRDNARAAGALSHRYTETRDLDEKDNILQSLSLLRGPESVDGLNSLDTFESNPELSKTIHEILSAKSHKF